MGFVDNTPSEVIDNLIAAHPALDPQRIDPAKIVPHTAQQLRAIWRSSHAAYRKLISGTPHPGRTKTTSTASAMDVWTRFMYTCTYKSDLD